MIANSNLLAPLERSTLIGQPTCENAKGQVHHTTRIREAKLTDIDDLLDQAEQFHAESSYKHIPINSDKLRSFYQTQVTLKTSLLLVAYQDDQLIGHFVAHIYDFYFSDARSAADLIFYVIPEKRGSRAAVSFVRRYQRWCQANKVVDASLSISTDIKTEKTSRFYSKLGFPLAGHLHKKQMA